MNVLSVLRRFTLREAGSGGGEGQRGGSRDLVEAGDVGHVYGLERHCCCGGRRRRRQRRRPETVGDDTSETEGVKGPL